MHPDPIKNITASPDAQTAKSSPATTQSFNQSLDRMAHNDSTQVELAAFERSTTATPGRLNGWRFARDEANWRAESRQD